MRGPASTAAAPSPEFRANEPSGRGALRLDVLGTGARRLGGKVRASDRQAMGFSFCFPIDAQLEPLFVVDWSETVVSRSLHGLRRPHPPAPSPAGRGGAGGKSEDVTPSTRGLAPPSPRGRGGWGVRSPQARTRTLKLLEPDRSGEERTHELNGRAGPAAREQFAQPAAVVLVEAGRGVAPVVDPRGEPAAVVAARERGVQVEDACRPRRTPAAGGSAAGAVCSVAW